MQKILETETAVFFAEWCFCCNPSEHPAGVDLFRVKFLFHGLEFSFKQLWSGCLARRPVWFFKSHRPRNRVTIKLPLATYLQRVPSSTWIQQAETHWKPPVPIGIYRKKIYNTVQYENMRVTIIMSGWLVNTCDHFTYLTYLNFLDIRGKFLIKHNHLWKWCRCFSAAACGRRLMPAVSSKNVLQTDRLAEICTESVLKYPTEGQMANGPSS